MSWPPDVNAPIDPHIRAFLDDIAEHPDDAGVRLIFADWLEERDDPRAELMRIQAECRPGVIPPGMQERLEEWLKSHANYWRPVLASDTFKYMRGLLDGELEVEEEDVPAFLEQAEWQALRGLLRDGWIRVLNVKGWDADQLARAGEFGLFAGPVELDLFIVPTCSLGVLGSASQLRKLSVTFNDSESTDEWLVHLAGLTKLRELHLRYAHAIGAGLAHLSNLTQLRRLALSCSDRLEDVAFEHLGALVGLEELDCSDCVAATDGGLAHLTRLTNLRKLNLHGNDWLTDVGLAHLGQLTNLTILTLSNCQNISDTGLAHFAGLTQLEKLELNYCGQLTGAGFAHLHALTSLQWLALKGCKLKAHETRALRKALPDCEVLRNVESAVRPLE